MNGKFLRSIHAVILEGPAGCGKTFLSEKVAGELGLQYLYYQAHAWSTAEDLVEGLDVPSIVLQQGENVRKMGKLVEAALLSQQGGVLLCLDEWDKGSPKLDALLLDFLQSGRIFYGGRELRANLSLLYCYVITNKERELADPLKSRCYHLEMGAPKEADIQVYLEMLGCSRAMGKNLQMVVRNSCVAGYVPSYRDFKKVWDLIQCQVETLDEVVEILRLSLGRKFHLSSFTSQWGNIKSELKLKGGKR